MQPADLRVARTEMWELGDRIVRRVDVLPGEDVLDVACGTGIAAIRAAQAGARVVGVDLTPALFEPGRRAAAQTGLELRWIAGDSEALPFGDASFDVVLSAFGAMFASDHAAAARELARVLRPGGRLAMLNWTGRGGPGELLAMVSAYVSDHPLLWGEEPHVRELFARTGLELSFEHEIARSPLRRSVSLADRVEPFMSIIGPAILLRRMAEERGDWPQLRARLERLYAIGDERADGHYLVVLGRKRRTG